MFEWMFLPVLYKNSAKNSMRFGSGSERQAFLETAEINASDAWTLFHSLEALLKIFEDDFWGARVLGKEFFWDSFAWFWWVLVAFGGFWLVRGLAGFLICTNLLKMIFCHPLGG